MATYECDDFRLSFEHATAAGYTVVARAVDGREVRSTFTMPMTPARLEEAVLQLDRSAARSGSRSTREVAPALAAVACANAEDLGGGLGRALFDSTIGPFYDDARRLAAARGRGVRLTLSLASTPELLSVPWELLYRRPSFLASQRRTPVVRYLEVGEPPPPAQIDGPVRVLGVVSSPAGLPPLDVADEKARVERALAHVVEMGLVELDWCDPATPRSLRERLRDGSYHVLHYVGHSDFTEAGDGVVFLVDATGAPAPVTDAALTNLLGDQESLRLAVLNSCEGARTTLTDPFAGIATSLVALGVPAVVAMQFTISDRAAIVFAEELFTSLIGRQYPIDAAVSEARKAVFTEVNEVEWATPVLFLRPADGQLFEFSAEPVPIPLVVAPTPIVVEEPPVTETHESDTAPAAPPPDTVAATATATAADAARVTQPEPVALTKAAPPSRPPAAATGPPGPRARSRRLTAIVAAAGAIAAVAAVAAVVASRGGDDASERRIEIAPTAGPLGATVEIHGGECPSAPDDAVRRGVAYWLDADHAGETLTVAAGDLDAEDGGWSAHLVVPADGPEDAVYRVGASCWSTDGNGNSANYFEYPTVPFEVSTG